MHIPIFKYLLGKRSALLPLIKALYNMKFVGKKSFMRNYTSTKGNSTSITSVNVYIRFGTRFAKKAMEDIRPVDNMR